MNLVKQVTLGLLLLCVSVSGYSQNKKDSATPLPLFTLEYNFQIPGGDLKDRFGPNSNIGAGFTYKFGNNFEIGARYNFLFGNFIKDTAMLNELRTNAGFIISQSGDEAIYQVFQRGHHVSFSVGKTFPVFSPNKNSGILISAGAGLLIHKLKYFNRANDIPQFYKENVKGYDRYTSGFATHQFLGYRYLSNSRLINFYAGFEFTQGFTKIQRNYQVDYPADFIPQQRLDLLYGIKFGWIILLNKRMSGDNFYY